MRRREIWELRVFHVGLPVSRLLVKKWRYLVHSRKGLGPRLIPWQRPNGCHSVYQLAYITGVKFEQHHSNISRYILDFE